MPNICAINIAVLILSVKTNKNTNNNKIKGIMSNLFFKPALEKIEKIDNLVAAYREADKKCFTNEGVKDCFQWLAAHEEEQAIARTLKAAITNFAKFLGYEIKLKYDYMERRIELYERMKIRVTRMMEQLHEDDYYYSELKAI